MSILLTLDDSAANLFYFYFLMKDVCPSAPFSTLPLHPHEPGSVSLTYTAIEGDRDREREREGKGEQKGHITVMPGATHK